MSTAEIEKNLEGFLLNAYPLLRREYCIFTLAAILSWNIFPLFIARVLCLYEKHRFEKENIPYKLYTVNKMNTMKAHYLLIISIVFFSLRELFGSWQKKEDYRSYGYEIVIGAVLLTILAIFAGLHLFKLRKKGIIEAVLFIMGYALYEQYMILRIINEDFQDQKHYSIMDTYFTYIADDYLAMKAMAISFLVLCILIFYTCYYYKRRLLFTMNRIQTVSCNYCGKPISRGDSFCSNCGKRLSLNPIKQMIEPLDRKEYCVICGNRILKEFCPKCSAAKNIEDLMKRSLKGKRRSLAAKSVLVIGLIALVIANVAGDQFNKLQIGRATANNEFVAKADELYENPEYVNNADWLIGFNTAIAAIYAADARWTYTNPRSVRSNEMAFFVLFSDASFQQMKILEQCKSMVSEYAGKLEDPEAFRQEYSNILTKYNQTINEQTNAIEYHGQMLASRTQKNMVDAFLQMCTDGVRFFFPYINTVLIAGVLYAFCLLMLIYVLESFGCVPKMKPEIFVQKQSIQKENYFVQYQYVYELPASTGLPYRLMIGGKRIFFSLVRMLYDLYFLFLNIATLLITFMSIFRFENIKSCSYWVVNNLKDDKNRENIYSKKYADYTGKERKLNVITGVILIVLIGITVIISKLHGTTNDVAMKQEYIYAAKLATVDYSLEITNILQNLDYETPENDQNLDDLIELLNLQIEADQAILNYNMKDMKEYQELHAGLCALCDADKDIAERILESLKNEKLPSEELCINYINLRGKNYSWVVTELLNETIGNLVEVGYE